MNPTLYVLNLFLMMVIYFCVGLLRDGLATWYTRSVSRAWVLSASTTAGSITLFDFIIIGTIAKMGWPVIPMLSYCIGCGVGTYIFMKIGRK